MINGRDRRTEIQGPGIGARCSVCRHRGSRLARGVRIESSPDSDGLRGLLRGGETADGICVYAWRLRHVGAITDRHDRAPFSDRHGGAVSLTANPSQLGPDLVIDVAELVWEPIAD